nr:vegetative cell wall protein gp1-like [Aegilops tauschii subsp. strangulata]
MPLPLPLSSSRRASLSLDAPARPKPPTPWPTPSTRPPSSPRAWSLTRSSVRLRCIVHEHRPELGRLQASPSSSSSRLHRHGVLASIRRLPSSLGLPDHVPGSMVSSSPVSPLSPLDLVAVCHCPCRARSLLCVCARRAPPSSPPTAPPPSLSRRGRLCFASAAPRPAPPGLGLCPAVPRPAPGCARSRLDRRHPAPRRGPPSPRGHPLCPGGGLAPSLPACATAAPPAFGRRRPRPAAPCSPAARLGRGHALGVCSRALAGSSRPATRYARSAGPLYH